MKKLTEYIKSKVPLPEEWAVYSIRLLDAKFLDGAALMEAIGDVPPSLTGVNKSTLEASFIIPMKTYNEIYR